MHFLYVIKNLVNNKVYVGQTVNIKNRWSAHKNYAINPEKTGQYIHRAMAKYGINNFTYEVITVCKTQEDADETEKILINQYKSTDSECGYNIAAGGGSAWNKGLPKEMQPRYGKVISTETRKKISESNKGKIIIITDEWKRKISESHKGKILSDEIKNKISESNKGVKRSEETKQKISTSMIGQKRRLGTKHKTESKIKMSKAKLKFTSQQEKEIMLLFNNGFTRVAIAKKYQCDRTTISNIIKRNKT